MPESTGTLFRGLELILQGHDPRDAVDYVQRICSVCPVTHGAAAAFALDDAFGLTGQIPDNGRIVRNLILGANLLHSHILHFYHLAALDYVKAPNLPPLVPQYAGDYRLPAAVNAAAVKHYLQALDMRKLAHQHAGDLGRSHPRPEGDRARRLLRQRRCGEDRPVQVHPGPIDRLHRQCLHSGCLSGSRGLQRLGGHRRGLQELDDLRRFPAGQQRLERQALLFERRLHQRPGWRPRSQADRRGRQVLLVQGRHPQGPVPERDHPGAGQAAGYSWIKSPRYDGNVVEVGPLAKLWINNNATLKSLLPGDAAFSVMGRHAARAVDCSNVAHAMADWLMQLTPGGPTCVPNEVPKHAEGMGINDAERGALGHWIVIDNWKIKIYNAIVPTTWNAGPRDDNGQLGPIEQALIGTPVKDTDNPIELVRVVRAFDPCLACAIHLITPDRKVRKFRVY